jgi:restriction endonuclease S subunit
MSEPVRNRIALQKIATCIKDGTHASHARTDDGIPLLSAKNISETGKLVITECEELISQAEYDFITSSFSPKANDLLIAIVGSIGRRALFNGSKVAFQRSVAFIRPNAAADPNYFQVIGSWDFQAQLKQRSNSTAQPGLYLGELAKTKIPLPSLPIQRRIAEILSTLDENIEQADALIGKYQQIKAGLIHDLFTRGLTPDGRLRPTRSEAPQLYKQSPLGWIPNEWEVATVGAITVQIEQGWSPDCDSECASEGQWGVLKTSAVTWSGFNTLENKRLPANLAPRREFKIEKDQLLMTRAGPSSRVGVVACVDVSPGNLMPSDKPKAACKIKNSNRRVWKCFERRALPL